MERSANQAQTSGKRKLPAFSNDWFEKHVRDWTGIVQSMNWPRSEPLSVVEIGSFEGRSALWILNNLMVHPDSRTYCIDTFEGGVEHSKRETEGLYERFQRNIAESPHAAKAEVRRGLSREMLVELLHEKVRADFVHVDGSHQAPDVLEDMVLSFRLLKPGGLMICDDYLWFMGGPGREDLVDSPKLAVDSFTSTYIRKIRLLHWQRLYQLAFVKTSE